MTYSCHIPRGWSCAGTYWVLYKYSMSVTFPKRRGGCDALRALTDGPSHDCSVIVPLILEESGKERPWKPLFGRSLQGFSGGSMVKGGTDSRATSCSGPSPSFFHLKLTMWVGWGTAKNGLLDEGLNLGRGEGKGR